MLYTFIYVLPQIYPVYDPVHNRPQRLFQSANSASERNIKTLTCCQITIQLIKKSWHLCTDPLPQASNTNSESSVDYNQQQDQGKWNLPRIKQHKHYNCCRDGDKTCYKNCATV